MSNGIIVLNGHGDHGETMALYVNGKLISTATIDGGKNGHTGKVYDYLGEFSVGPTQCGITDITVMDQFPDLVTQFLPCINETDDCTDEQVAEWDRMQDAGIINDDGQYKLTENLSDIPRSAYDLASS